MKTFDIHSQVETTLFRFIAHLISFVGKSSGVLFVGNFFETQLNWPVIYVDNFYTYIGARTALIYRGVHSWIPSMDSLFFLFHLSCANMSCANLISFLSNIIYWRAVSVAAVPRWFCVFFATITNWKKSQ